MGNTINERSGRRAYSKLTLLCRSYGLSGARLGAFVRGHGIYLSDLTLWKEQMLLGLENETQMANSSRLVFRKRLANLEQRLAEAQAIIEAQKKVLKFREDGEQKLVKASVLTSSKSSKKRSAKVPARKKSSQA